MKTVIQKTHKSRKEETMAYLKEINEKKKMKYTNQNFFSLIKYPPCL